MRRSWPDTRAGVVGMMREELLEEVALKIEKMTDAETARWVPDPQVENVWGLRRVADDKILVVAYLADCDFEIADELL